MTATKLDREQQKFLRGYIGERFAYQKWSAFRNRAKREIPQPAELREAKRLVKRLNSKISAYDKRLEARQESLKERFGQLRSEAEKAILFGTEKDVQRVIKKMAAFGPLD